MEELEAVCEELTSAVNRTGQQVKRDENGIMVLTEDVSVHAVRAMEKLAWNIPAWRAATRSPMAWNFPGSCPSSS